MAITFRPQSATVVPEPPPPPPPSALRFAADFVASWQTFAATLILAHPVDTLRVRYQTVGERPMAVLRADGVRALYAGFLTPVVSNGPIVGMIFATNEFYRPVMRRIHGAISSHLGHGWSEGSAKVATGAALSVDEYTTGELAAAGFMTGVTCSVLQCPANTIRVHQQLSAHSGTAGLSARESAALLRAECGGSWRGIFRALPAEAAANGIGRMFYFTIYEALKRWSRSVFGNDRADTMPVKLALGASTAVLGWVVNFPVDVVKTRLQGDAIAIDPRGPVAHALPPKARAYVAARAATAAAAGRPGPRMYDGFTHCATELYRNFGLRGFYRGFGLTSLRCSVSAGFSLPLFELVKPSYHVAFGVAESAA